MRFGVIGAGAIGAYVGAALARGGAEVVVLARGAHRQAMAERGSIVVKSARGDFEAPVRAVERVDDLGPLDVAILGLKAHQLAPFAPWLADASRSGTAMIGMQNGIPWWYFQRHGGPYEGLVLESVDPGGLLAKAIAPEAAIGCVVWSSTEIEAPGVIRHVEGTRYSLGEPDRTISERVQKISAAFIAGGLKAPVEADIRKDIWTKLLGNASFNPVSALTRATLEAIAVDAGTQALVAEVMGECVAVAERLGITFDISIEKRIDGARRVGAHKTSMLQDLEAGKPLELDALTGAVVELGERLGIPTPATRHIYALTRLLDAQRAPSA